MSAAEIIDTMGDLETLSTNLATQLKQLENLISTNRRSRTLLLNSELPQGELTNAIRKLDLLYLQAIRSRSNASILLRDLEDTISLELILEYI